MTRNVYELHACVCVLDSPPRVPPYNTGEDKTARGRRGCKNTQTTNQPKFVLLLLLLLLQRIRNVVVVGYLRRVRIRFVYEVLSGRWE